MVSPRRNECEERAFHQNLTGCPSRPRRLRRRLPAGRTMHPYPHTYVASAEGTNAGFVAVESPQLPAIESAAPPEFDGPSGVWSPETLLCASVADCFILTFRAVARAARLEWIKLECRVEGVLERMERVSRFTKFSTFARLSVPKGVDAAKARELLERAEQGCLIANSLVGARSLQTDVVITNRSDTQENDREQETRVAEIHP
jgi:organic hydroperoxide reductase OsmC/OhrA